MFYSPLSKFRGILANKETADNHIMFLLYPSFKEFMTIVHYLILLSLATYKMACKPRFF